MEEKRTSIFFMYDPISEIMQRTWVLYVHFKVLCTKCKMKYRDICLLDICFKFKRSHNFLEFNFDAGFDFIHLKVANVD
jgi:hypothetical protein